MTGAEAIQNGSPRNRPPRDSPPSSLTATGRLIDVAGVNFNR